MPLVVPGVNSPDASTAGTDWTMKLLGKKIGDKHDETVSLPLYLPPTVSTPRPFISRFMKFESLKSED